MSGTKIYGWLAHVVMSLPEPSADIAERLGVASTTVAEWLRQLRAEGVVVRGPNRGGKPVVWTRQDAKPFDRKACDACYHVARFAAAWRELARRRHTAASLATALGLSLRSAHTIIEQMHDQRAIRIAGWEIHGQTPTAQWDRMQGADAPRPPRVDKVEINRRHWAARKARMQAQSASMGAVHA